MAAATALTVASIAAAVIGTGVSIYSQQQQAESAQRAAEYNNRLASQEAHNRELEAAEQARRARIENRRRMASIRARLAGSGTLTTTGTPLAILGESSSNLDLQIQDALRATNMQATAMRAQGQMGLWEAGQAQSAASLSAIGTGLGGFSSALSGYSSAVYQNALPDTFGLYSRPRQ